MFDWKKYEDKFLNEEKNIINWMRSEFNKLHVGRANPALLDTVNVIAYGENMKINQLANVSVPDPRTLLITPYDKSTIKDIATGINAANIGVNPIVDADCIRITFPAPTEDARKQLVKKAKMVLEDSKIKVRLYRQQLQDEFKKELDVLEDDKKKFQQEIDKVTKKVNSNLETEFNTKEKDIMKI